MTRKWQSPSVYGSEIYRDISYIRRNWDSQSWKFHRSLEKIQKFSIWNTHNLTISERKSDKSERCPWSGNTVDRFLSCNPDSPHWRLEQSCARSRPSRSHQIIRDYIDDIQWTLDTSCGCNRYIVIKEFISAYTDFSPCWVANEFTSIEYRICFEEHLCHWKIVWK